jgi:D-serine deaminase-like pyridoxal phosphate-dependent protein
MMTMQPGILATIDAIGTPALLLDEARMTHNIARLREHLLKLGPRLRPHLKTSKCLQAARLVMDSPSGPATVSTLKEAEQFAAGGVRDILYSVGITPNKLDRVTALRRRNIDLSIVVDSIEAAQAVAAHTRATGEKIPTLIEIDSDSHRAGVRRSQASLLIEIGRILHESNAELRGVMTHAGESYHCFGSEALASMAEQERVEAVDCAFLLNAAGLPAPVVSVGSTPTAHFSRDLTGVTEVRAGVFVFFDLFMAGLGVCTIDDIALSVVATVIGHEAKKGWILVDAGWMAMSCDQSTNSQSVDQKYGLVCDVDGNPYPDLVMVKANQEQGIVALRPNSSASLPELPVGAIVRILPNHACATGAQHDHYNVITTGSRQIHAIWPRFNGW